MIHLLLGKEKQPRGLGSQHLATVRVIGLWHKHKIRYCNAWPKLAFSTACFRGSVSSRNVPAQLAPSQASGHVPPASTDRVTWWAMGTAALQAGLSGKDGH